MVIFHSYVKLPEGTRLEQFCFQAPPKTRDGQIIADEKHPPKTPYFPKISSVPIT